MAGDVEKTAMTKAAIAPPAILAVSHPAGVIPPERRSERTQRRAVSTTAGTLIMLWIRYEILP